jgi:hypothetical protein
MLRFKQDDTSIALILTLTELATTPLPDYYFVFTHVTTKEVVTFTKVNADDESLFKYRYNKFTIDPSTVFAGKQVGEWHYKVYENNANGVLLEQGKMILDRATDFAFDKYNSATTFKVYNG